MRKMKRIFLCLSVLFASQLLTGQDYYHEVLKAVSLAGRGEVPAAAALLADMPELNSDAGLLLEARQSANLDFPMQRNDAAR